MYKLKVLILIIFPLANCESKCDETAKIALKVHQDVSSASENATTQGAIRYDEDIFHLLIINQTLPKLCPNFVTIQNELSILQLINSSIEEISPGAFNVTPTLTLLKISKNPLTTVEKDVFNSIKVKEIDLSQNQLISLHPETFDNITELQIVNLSHNQIRNIDPNWFRNSPNVYKFTAVYNDIKTIPGEAFKHMATSRPLKLRLSANRIKEISPEAFGDRNLQLLRINGNKLAVLPDSLFVNWTVRNLQVNANELQCFPEALFNSSIESLTFVDNAPFQCDCLKRVRKFAEDTQVKVIYPSVICEDKIKEVNIVFNYNKTYEIPLIPPAVDVDVYGNPDHVT